MSAIIANIKHIRQQFGHFFAKHSIFIDYNDHTCDVRVYETNKKNTMVFVVFETPHKGELQYNRFNNEMKLIADVGISTEYRREGEVEILDDYLFKSKEKGGDEGLIEFLILKFNKSTTQTTMDVLTTLIKTFHNLNTILDDKVFLRIYTDTSNDLYFPDTFIGGTAFKDLKLIYLIARGKTAVQEFFEDNSDFVIYDKFQPEGDFQKVRDLIKKVQNENNDILQLDLGCLKLKAGNYTLKNICNKLLDVIVNLHNVEHQEEEDIQSYSNLIKEIKKKIKLCMKKIKKYYFENLILIYKSGKALMPPISSRRNEYRRILDLCAHKYNDRFIITIHELLHMFRLCVHKYISACISIKQYHHPNPTPPRTINDIRKMIWGEFYDFTIQILKKNLEVKVSKLHEHNNVWNTHIEQMMFHQTYPDLDEEHIKSLYVPINNWIFSEFNKSHSLYYNRLDDSLDNRDRDIQKLIEELVKFEILRHHDNTIEGKHFYPEISYSDLNEKFEKKLNDIEAICQNMTTTSKTSSSRKRPRDSLSLYSAVAAAAAPQSSNQTKKARSKSPSDSAVAAATAPQSSNQTKKKRSKSPSDSAVAAAAAAAALQSSNQTKKKRSKQIETLNGMSEQEQNKVFLILSYHPEFTFRNVIKHVKAESKAEAKAEAKAKAKAEAEAEAKAEVKAKAEAKAEAKAAESKAKSESEAKKNKEEWEAKGKKALLDRKEKFPDWTDDSESEDES